MCIQSHAFTLEAEACMPHLLKALNADAACALDVRICQGCLESGSAICAWFSCQA